MLNARHEISASRKHVGEERVFREFYGIAVINNGDRQGEHAGIRLHLLVPADSDRDIDLAITRSVIERESLVTDRPFARGEIRDDDDRKQTKQDENSALHHVLEIVRCLCPDHPSQHSVLESLALVQLDDDRLATSQLNSTSCV